jgi:hypothetical protein
VAVLGEILVRVGVGFGGGGAGLIVKIFTAVRSLAGICAVSVVLLMKVVVLADPFHRTEEVLTQLDPETVSVNAGLPAVVELGAIAAKIGAGFPTVNDRMEEVPPPGAGL